MHHWHISDDFHQASTAAAAFITEFLSRCLAQQSACHVILPGGRTPGECLQQLAQAELDWERLHWYPGDERCLPPGDAERNDSMLQALFFQYLPVSHFYPIQAELPAEQAAEAYLQTIATVKQFDLAFLGMGEDGHTASLFPANTALDDPRRVVPVYDSPKPPPERITMGLETLRACSCKVVLACGAGKAGVIEAIRDGLDVPINRIGDIHWFIDHEASGLSSE